MARGKYTETDDLRGLRDVVEWAQDGTGPPKHLIWLGDGVPWFIRDVHGEGVHVPWPSEPDEKWPDEPAYMERIRKDLRTLLLVAAKGPPDWAECLDDLNIRPELFPLVGKAVWNPEAHNDNRHRFFAVSGHLREIVLFQVGTFLARVGEDRLRVCPAPDCGRVFVKVGSRQYCSERCQRRVFLKDYDPFAAQPRRKDKPHGKKTR